MSYFAFEEMKRAAGETSERPKPPPMNLNKKQGEVMAKIQTIAEIFEIEPEWAIAVALVESSLGLHQKSPTGCRGVFQMSSIAMKDLLLEMEKTDDDLIDIVCGVAFLRLLLRRWKTIEKATAHFCDPNDRHFYIDKVKKYMEKMNDIGKGPVAMWIG